MAVGRRTWLRNVVAKQKQSRVIRRAVVDVLEPRRLLTSVLDGAGMLSVDGTGGNGDISIAVSGGTLTVSLNGVMDGTFTTTDVTAIEVSGGDGDDSISLAGVAIDATLSGGGGEDKPGGRSGGGFLSGEDGEDTVFFNKSKGGIPRGRDGGGKGGAVFPTGTI